MGGNLSIVFCGDGGGRFVSPTPSLQYWAGFFDGEGHVTIGKAGTVKCGITQNDASVLEMLVPEFGGKVYRKGIKSATGQSSSVWQLNDARGVLDFLEDVRPYLVVKAKEADIAMECARLVRTDNVGCNPLAPEERTKREELRDRLLELRPKKTASHKERVGVSERNKIKEKYNYCCSDCDKDISEHPIQSQIIMDDKLLCRKCFMRIVQPVRIKHRTKEQVIEALESSKSVEEAAGKLSINRSSLYAKRKHYGLLNI